MIVMCCWGTRFSVQSYIMSFNYRDDNNKLRIHPLSSVFLFQILQFVLQDVSSRFNKIFQILNHFTKLTHLLALLLKYTEEFIKWTFSSSPLCCGSEGVEAALALAGVNSLSVSLEEWAGCWGAAGMQLPLSEPPSTRPLDQLWPRIPGWDALTAGPLGWASEPAGRGVGHCVERALAEDGLGCRHKQTPVSCLMASQVQRWRPLSGTQLLRKPVFRMERWGNAAALRKAFPFLWLHIFGFTDNHVHGNLQWGSASA